MTTFKEYFTIKLSIDTNRINSKLFYQNRREKNVEIYFNRDDRFFYILNNVYNNSRQQRKNHFSRLKVIIKIGKTSLNDRKFNKNRRNRFYNKRNRHKNKIELTINEKISVHINNKEKSKI